MLALSVIDEAINSCSFVKGPPVLQTAGVLE